MEFTTFIRKPFTVEAVEITDDNIIEVAKLIGELRTKGDTPFIQLDRRLVPNVQRAYIGWFVTRLGENFRAYSPRVFNEQFTTYEPVASFVFEQTDDEFDQAPPHGMPRPTVFEMIADDGDDKVNEYVGEVVIDDPETVYNPPIRTTSGLGLAID